MITGGLFMEKKKLKKYKMKFILTAVLLIAIAAAASGSILHFKADDTYAKIHKIEKEREVRYEFKGLDALSFLTDKQKGEYKTEMIDACEAYNLQNLKVITIEEKTIQFDKTTNMYEWKVSCDDKRHAKFISVYKKTTNRFTSELDRVDKKKTQDDDEVTESGCRIASIICPEDCAFLKSEKQREAFKQDLEAYLALEELEECKTVRFEKYLDKSKKELLFSVDEPKPVYIETITVRTDENGNLNYEIGAGENADD